MIRDSKDASLGRPRGVSRRSFLKWSSAGGSAAFAASALSELESLATMLSPEHTAGRSLKIRVGCPSHNCGGRCLLIAHLEDGVLTRLETDDRQPDSVADPQLRACVRGRAYRHRQYHPDRLKHPMRRLGPRGEGHFERITWDEALDQLASELRRIKSTYGNSAIYVPYGTGSYNQLNGRQTATRLLNLFGGCLGR